MEGVHPALPEDVAAASLAAGHVEEPRCEECGQPVVYTVNLDTTGTTGLGRQGCDQRFAWSAYARIAAREGRTVLGRSLAVK